MNTLPLSLAIGSYAHTQDLADDSVRPKGIALSTSILPIEVISARFSAFQDFDVAEFSLGSFCAHLASTSEARMVGLPVFLSRAFRHSAIYVRTDAGLAGASDLAGRRVGIPEWAQTAVIYMRGVLQHDAGVALDSVHWVQAGVDQPGRSDKAPVTLPPGVKVERRPADTLSGMLLNGELDAIISARPPAAFLARDPRIERLYPDYQAAEQDYYRRSGVFPIMHIIAVRRDIYERHRWIARNLVDAFEAAKANAVARLRNTQVSYLPVPWGPHDFERRAQFVFGADAWPYGAQANAVTLDAFLGFCHEQGVTRRRLNRDELFAPETALSINI